MQQTARPANLQKCERLFQLALGLVVVEGLLANIFYFLRSSESQSAFLWGYSLQRLAVGAFSLACLVAFGGLLALTFLNKSTASRGLQKLVDYFSPPSHRIVSLAPLGILLALDLGLNLLYHFPGFFNLVVFISIKRSILRQSGLVQIWDFLTPIQIWLFLIGLKFLVFLLVIGRQAQSRRGTQDVPAQLTLLCASAAVTTFILTGLWIFLFKVDIALAWTGPGLKLALLAAWFGAGSALGKNQDGPPERRMTIFIGLSIWIVTFLYSAQLAQWMNALNTPFKNYWNWLADAFLHGRMYIIDPPSTGDMTLVNGRWYVPIPPLPAILMMPFIALLGVEGFNTTLFSIVLSSTTSALLYLCLDELSRLKWIRLNHAGQLWLVALFTFGTVQMWLSISSVVWYFSQVCTVFFVALAFTLALKRAPAWLAGTSLALSLLARPNVFVIWAALVMIILQLQMDRDGNFSWKRILPWAAWSALPVFASACLLLTYNFLRFGSFLDFGYVNINGSIYVMENVRKYGMFNLHFVPINFETVFMTLNTLTAKCGYYFPRGNGLGLLVTTPAFVYALRRFKFSWWLAGCWTSILLSLVLLMMYHNNGAVQIAYRYVMDFAFPLLLVMSFSAGERISPPLKALIILSILINYYAIISWYFGPC